MKHSYRAECGCERCTKELARRTAQSAAAFRANPRPLKRASQRPSTRRPTPGSAEWAETRGDDLGESPDY